MATASPSSTFRSLGLDVGLPLGLYFLLHAGFGLSLVTALAVSSIPPAIREVVAVAHEHRLNPLAALMLVTNLAGILTGFLSGDARLMFAKDSVISSIIAFSILGSVWKGRPLMSEGLEAFLVRGDADRAAAWGRLRAGAGDFRRFERGYSLVWGCVLLGDCAARLVGAFVLPVSTMSWASTAVLIGALVIASLLSGVLYANRIGGLLERELGGASAPGARGRPGRRSGSTGVAAA